MKAAASFIIAAALVAIAMVLADGLVALSPATPSISGDERLSHLWLVLASAAIVVPVAGAVAWSALRRPADGAGSGAPAALPLGTMSPHRWLVLFGVAAALQVGHLGEHGAQLAQLVMTDGALHESHGMVGRLDFEPVHFFWDSAIWLTTLLLAWRYGRDNFWLWLSLFFASVHQAEHMYLYYVSLFQPDFYQNSGGFAGVLGKGGILPTVERPYLHFFYNFMVVIPFVTAFFREMQPSRRPLYSPVGPAEA